MNIRSEITAIETEFFPKIEAKVKAASTAASATGFPVTLASVLLLHSGAVPAIVASLIGAAVTGGLTFTAGWLAKHTPRPGDTPPTVSQNAPVASPTTPPAPPTA